MYTVTKKFTNGALKGIIITENSPVPMTIGKEYKPCAGSSNYIVTNCIKA